MLRKLIMLVCLFSATNVLAQKASQPPVPAKTTQNQVDYKQMGAPLAPFVLLPFHDTSTKKTAATTAKNDSLLTNKEKRKAKKIEKQQKELAEEKRAAQKSIVTEKDFDNGANLFVMMFNPTCSHCTDQTQTFEKNIALFKKSKLVLMANPTMKPYLQDFVKTYHTDDYFPTINVGMDSTGFMNNVFLYQALPQINIYDGDRKLIRTFTGNVAIDSVKKYIQ